MAEGNPTAGFESQRATASAIATGIRKQLDLLEALRTLRALGDEGEDAVDAVLNVRAIKVLMVSWELFEALARDSGHSAERLLRDFIPGQTIGRVRTALFGDPPRFVIVDDDYC